MPRTLYGKLVIALAALIGVVGVIYVALSVATTRLHFQEVNQRLNETVAQLQSIEALSPASLAIRLQKGR